MVKHYDLVCACINGLEFSEDALNVVEGFQFVGCAVDHVASVPGDYRGHSLLPGLLAVGWCDGLAHYDGGRFRRALRVESKISPSPGNDEPDVSVHHVIFFFSSRRRHTRSDRDWSSDVCSSD